VKISKYYKSKAGGEPCRPLAKCRPCRLVSPPSRLTGLLGSECSIRWIGARPRTDRRLSVQSNERNFTPVGQSLNKQKDLAYDQLTNPHRREGSPSRPSVAPPVRRANPPSGEPYPLRSRNQKVGTALRAVRRSDASMPQSAQTQWILPF
jgi:hypothetical protein